MKIFLPGPRSRRLATRAAELLMLAALVAIGVEGVHSIAGGANADAANENAESPLCRANTDVFNASPRVNARSQANWHCNDGERTLTGNGIPDHGISGGQFRTPISAQDVAARMPLNPAQDAAATYLDRQAVGYVLNGVKLDPGTDGSCSGNASSTARGAGCVAARGRDPWRLEAIGGAFVFGTDENNGHVQPNGQYHYHGVPEGFLLKAGRGKAMTLVGFAIDGFPIYARYGYADARRAASGVTVMRPSWQKKDVPDHGRPALAQFPMGTFTSDYQYVAGSGDLDECNGRTGVTPEYPKGIYHYFITDTFPFIQRCFKGKR